ncbi:oligosaccharide flippase family protein [Dyadobacter frigoris]|uniref:Uncharacterized protein n=1 Tax=Dyadobacter frigoris TaxID=2576211 RepID=A0A4U6D8U4_9BACT|nr:oligosaccharide flippase family protein [Dyadobacter frigoris]TKT90614.1 hypothetical protein FDK13_20030 [Dyadobacter frigoris]GLU51237.1 hypothetical protein Dfri01_06980 [Dyadobacter frigoris]
MKNKLLQNLSANTLQLIINQLSGLVIFYILSTGLDKTYYGQLNLALAILLVSFNLLSFGIEQVSVRKVAAGQDAESVFSLYLFHVLITGFVFYILLLASSIFIQTPKGLYPLLLLLGAGKLMIYFATPFKQIISGLERFKVLSLMLVVSNLVRSCGLIILFFLQILSLQTAIIIFIAGDFTELLLCIFLFRRSTQIAIRINGNKKQYFQLIRQSLPQTGVTILTSAIARFDWIFIGFMVSAAKLAEYGFAYKVLEMATFPLLAIAPLLIPMFTKFFQKEKTGAVELAFLIRIELVVAALTALILNVTWVQVVDTATAGKYGLVNVNTIFILSLCLPFLYLNNFFWTIYFAQGRIKMILKGFAITFTVNVGLDILLIPFFKNEGAAMAFLIACAVQAIFYTSQNQIRELGKVWHHVVLCSGCAILSGFVSRAVFAHFLIALISSVLLFLLLLILTSQVKISDRKIVRNVFSK